MVYVDYDSVAVSPTPARYLATSSRVIAVCA